MAHHPEFESAGKKSGLQVWRVEKMDLKPVPTDHQRQFYSGDTYVLLKTEALGTNRSYNLHMWIGKESSMDEQAAAAILMKQMDDYLGGAPRQFRECQGNESQEFLSNYKQGVVYLKGGVSSGLNIVSKDNIQRLMHVKGRRQVRASEVEMDWRSFTRGDCFIIELTNNMFLWSGSESNCFERLKAAEIAIDIRDLERMGRVKLNFVAEGEEPEPVLRVLGPKPATLPEASCDKITDVVNKKKASLYMVSNASGRMSRTLVADSNPFKQNMLKQKECYVLDSGESIFVWKGKDADPEERKAALNIAEDFIKENNYPLNTQVSILPQGGESPLFKQYFPCWLDKDESTGPTKAMRAIGSIANVVRVPFDESQMHSNSQMAAQHCMVDDGSGTVEIWRVEGGDKEPVDPKLYGQFYGGDCYLILYSYTTKHLIYTWQGLKSSQDERGASAILTVGLDESMGGVATQVRVVQGHEPAHLLSLFKDKPLIVHLGGTSRKRGESKPSSTRLFHIRMKSNGRSYAVEVLPESSRLNTNDVFVLKSPEGSSVWIGQGARPEEMNAAKYVAKVLGGNFPEIHEFKEPASFWTALGGKKSYQTSPMLQNTLRPPRLFGCSNKTGTIMAEEVVGSFTQSDLATDDVMILDAWEQIFVWIGKDANEYERTESFKIAQAYIRSDPAGRADIPVITIKQGQEPPSFTGWFHAWDPKMWERDPFSFLQTRVQNLN